MRRQNNQDAMNVLVASDGDYWEQRGHLFIVCDGMGAHAAGELASKMAADGVAHTYNKDENAEPAAALQKAILGANRQIFDKGRADLEFQGMGTTCSAMVLLPEGITIGHVGDSRIYRCRDNQLEQLTFDHSLVWEVRAASGSDDESAGINLPKNIITRSLGPSPQVKVDLEGPLPVQTGDKYLLCSDGLTGPLSDVVVGTLLNCLPPAEAVRVLVDLANLRGGPDNITVVIVEAEEQLESEEEEDDGGRRIKSRLLWATSIIAAVTAGVTWITENYVPSMLSMVGALCAAVMALFVQFRREEEDDDRPVRPLGQAPYATFDCSPGTETLELLANVLERLKQVVDDSSASLDADVVEQLQQRPDQRSSDADASETVRRDSRLICAVVAELRKAKTDRNRFSDSAFDML